MPKSAYYTLTWSSSHQAYELYEGQGDDALDLIPDSLAWLVWVSQVSSFAFHGQHGSCTVRKERKRRGGEYWYAYARVEGNLSKRYLGRESDLTLRRLEQVAQAFGLDGQAVAPQKQAGASVQARPASPTRRRERGAGLPERSPGQVVRRQPGKSRALGAAERGCTAASWWRGQPWGAQDRPREG